MPTNPTLEFTTCNRLDTCDKYANHENFNHLDLCGALDDSNDVCDKLNKDCVF